MNVLMRIELSSEIILTFSSVYCFLEDHKIKLKPICFEGFHMFNWNAKFLALKSFQ